MEQLLVVFTLAEAAALVARFSAADRSAELIGLTKIRTALEGASHPKRPMAKAALQTEPRETADDVAPLRAKDYRRSDRTVPVRRRKPPIGLPAIAPDEDVDFVPFRDEAGGIYK